MKHCWIGRNAFLVLNLCFDIVNCVRRFHLEGDHLAHEGLYKGIFQPNVMRSCSPAFAHAVIVCPCLPMSTTVPIPVVPILETLYNPYSCNSYYVIWKLYFQNMWYDGHWFLKSMSRSRSKTRKHTWGSVKAKRCMLPLPLPWWPVSTNVGKIFIFMLKFFLVAYLIDMCVTLCE